MLAQTKQADCIGGKHAYSMESPASEIAPDWLYRLSKGQKSGSC